ncbi:MAG: hypothetical protein V3U34_00530 [candidate division NC10 bacterium]
MSDRCPCDECCAERAHAAQFDKITVDIARAIAERDRALEAGKMLIAQRDEARAERDAALSKVRRAVETGRTLIRQRREAWDEVVRLGDMTAERGAALADEVILELRVELGKRTRERDQAMREVRHFKSLLADPNYIAALHEVQERKAVSERCTDPNHSKREGGGSDE